MRLSAVGYSYVLFMWSVFYVVCTSGGKCIRPESISYLVCVYIFAWNFHLKCVNPMCSSRSREQTLSHCVKQKQLVNFFEETFDSMASNPWYRSGCRAHRHAHDRDRNRTNWHVNSVRCRVMWWLPSSCREEEEEEESERNFWLLTWTAAERNGAFTRQGNTASC